MASSARRSNSSSMAITATLLLISVVCSSVSGFRGRVGGRTEVKDVKSNEQVQELGRFSVEEYNRMRRQSGHGNGEVTFSQVINVSWANCDCNTASSHNLPSYNYIHTAAYWN